MSQVDRRTFLRTGIAAAAATCVPIRAQDKPRDVSWLAEIQSRPEKLPDNAPQLSNLLVDAGGQRISTLEGWKQHREELKRWWLEFLGTMPALRKSPPKLEVVSEERIQGIVRQLVRYDVEPGLSTEAYLCLPDRAFDRAAGLVAFHSTVDHSIRQPAGVEGAPEKAFGLRYAREGMVVFCPRNYLWPESGRIAAAEEAKKYHARVPGSSGMAKMLYDAQVAVDILAATPGVDAERLGAVGHSLGAKEVLYLAALDDRIQVTVSSEGGIGTRFSNWDAEWYLGAKIREPSFAHEHHELLALVAPRPFLLVGGDSADGDCGWPFIERALDVYKLYGQPCRVGQYNHRQGHAVPPEAQVRIDEWLKTYL